MGSWVPTPGYFINGFSNPNPWLFYFSSRPFGACFIQQNPMISMPTSPSESLLLFNPWTQLRFDVTGFKNTEASRDNRSCHFHAQLSMYRVCCTCSLASFITSSQRRFQRHVLPPRKWSLLAHDNRLCLTPKTSSSVPCAPLNRHYQCTHEFSRVSGHFTHCWAYRPVYREMNSLVVKVSKLVHFQPDFRTFAHAVLNSSRAVCFQ